MSKVVNLDDHKEVWLPATCLCVNCSHLWDAVVHEERMTRLECPECGEMKGAVIKMHYEG